MIRKTMIRIEQPVGVFYICNMKISEIDSCADIRRREDGLGVQRRLSRAKIEEIKRYCCDPEATFPTSIILATDAEISDSAFVLEEINDGLWNFQCDDGKFFDIIDGQHRFIALKEANMNVDMPVVIMFNLTEEEKAYVFSTINSNQTKVDKSNIYDLFELSEKRSPYKTGHDIAKIFNMSSDSPFYDKLKMLGHGTSDQTLSQGTFVTEIVKLMSKNPKQDMYDIKNGKSLVDNEALPLRKYFINDQDDIIFKVLNNYFGAVSDVFLEEWEQPNKYILRKTTGFGALIKVFPNLFGLGKKEKNLTKEFFSAKFRIAKKSFEEINISLTAEKFGSGEAAQKKLSQEFMKSWEH